MVVNSALEKKLKKYTLLWEKHYSHSLPLVALSKTHPLQPSERSFPEARGSYSYFLLPTAIPLQAKHITDFATGTSIVYNGLISRNLHLSHDWIKHTSSWLSNTGIKKAGVNSDKVSHSCFTAQ